MAGPKRKQPNNYLQNLEARAEVSFQALSDEILSALSGISPFDSNILATRKVQQALAQVRYEERMRQTIATASLASANEALGPLAIASADRYIRWRMHEVYDGVTLSQTLRHNAAQTAEILTDTIRAQLKNGGTWTQLAQEITRHDKVSDISVTLAELAKAGKKMNVNPQEINRLVGKAQRYINTLSPNDAPTPYLKKAYQNLINVVEKGAGEDAINKALGRAMDEKIRYNAERISRTEIARAHNEAFHARYDNDPDITGYQWVLSSRHVVVDECTMIADIDNGAGKGVYTKKDCPQIPIHPHCMCMLVPYFDEPPDRTTFTTFKDYLEGQPDDKRADIIGKANAQSPVLYRRGLERRGINPDSPGVPRRIPEELLTLRGGVVGAASGALDAESDRAQAHAEQYYEAIRNRKSDSDVKSIAKNINFPEKVVKDIKTHIFLEEHNLGDGEIGRFSPDYDMAQTWQRLIQDKHTELDIMLMKHEMVEYTQMKRHGYDYMTAHDIANVYHNWESEIKKLKEGGG
jgi:SPP1 gp7 family putative phage head morphogenesis protein